MKNRMRSLLIVLSVVILLCSNAFAAITTNMEISQVVQDGSGISMYANLMDDGGNSTGEEFTEDKFTGMIDGNEFAADVAINFNSTGEGIYYVVCVDISKSLNTEDMANIKVALEKFISYLNPADYMSIYSFGTNVMPLVIESNNKDELRTAAAGLACTDMNTQLYGVVNEALSLARVRSASMPARSAVIVITDGTDDPSAGKGDLYTYDNTLNIVMESGTPVYTLAVEKDNQQLDNLQSFADVSGGELIKAEPKYIEEELNRMRMQIRSATLVHIPLMNDEGRNGIGTHEIGLALSVGDKKIVASNPYSMDIDWFAVPAARPEETATAEPVATAAPEISITAALEAAIEEVTEAQVNADASSKPAIEEETIEYDGAEPENSLNDGSSMDIKKIISGFGDYIWFICAAAFLLIALVILLVVLRSGKRKKDQSQYMDAWGNNTFNSAWDTDSAYDFVVSDSDEGSAGGYAAPTERIGSQTAHAAPTERIGSQAAHAAPTERIGSQAAHAAPTERIGAQAAYAAPTERIGSQAAHAAPTERIGSQAAFAAPTERIGSLAAHAAPTERIGSQAAYAAPTERIGSQTAHAAPTERIGSQTAHAAPTERIGAQAAYAAPTERIGSQTAHAAPTERIGAQAAYAAPTERIGSQTAHAAPTERIGQAGAQSVPAVDVLTASSGTVRLAPQENGVKIQVEERRRSAGVDNTRIVYLEKVLIFGRNFDCDYMIQDDAASGEHFKLTREVDGIYITDLKSSNGTMLNGKTLYAATALRSEDVIKAGVTTLRIRFEE